MPIPGYQGVVIYESHHTDPNWVKMISIGEQRVVLSNDIYLSTEKKEYEVHIKDSQKHTILEHRWLDTPLDSGSEKLGDIIEELMAKALKKIEHRERV